MYSNVDPIRSYTFTLPGGRKVLVQGTTWACARARAKRLYGVRDEQIK